MNFSEEPKKSTKTEHHISVATQQSTLEEIAEYVRAHIGEWLAEQSFAKPSLVYEIELRERMIRVEEELKYQRELMKQGFDLMEKRFEAIDKRFEAMTQENNRRFDEVNKRFEKVDERFEKMDERFEEMNKRIERLIIWSFGATMGMGSLVIAALKLL
uniref:DUF1640 domain-containing protein n=1 Tax=Candidatus Kentrum sp. TC TaxID=2126339 RepID=A0A450YEA1_9GAMM|nr:MAG: hypothetical protein BECKTC1821E_GA0114239_100581 [Candidatus Kentron sp. TC]